MNAEDEWDELVYGPRRHPLLRLRPKYNDPAPVEEAPKDGDVG